MYKYAHAGIIFSHHARQYSKHSYFERETLHHNTITFNVQAIIIRISDVFARYASYDSDIVLVPVVSHQY